MAGSVSKRIEDLSPEKRALLLEKLRQKAFATAAEQGITRRADQSTYPLSFAQQRLWILSQLEPDSPFYNISLTLRLSGGLNVQALEDAINEVIARHEVLRASFATQRGSPVQVIAPTLLLSLEAEDVAGADPESAAMAIATAEARRSFDLARGPLLRARLLRITDGEHLALLTFHHIVMDGWSTSVLVRELVTLYQAYDRDGVSIKLESPLPALPIQYADFAAWQREQLQGERLRAEVEFWVNQLQGIPPMLELPTDKPRPAVQTVNGTICPFVLPQELSEQLAHFAQEHGATLFHVMLAAFQVLLHRYSHQDDICVGTPIANRNRKEVEELVGFFVNTLVMRSTFFDNPNFLTVLARLKELALAAQSHQDLPFEMLVDELNAKGLSAAQRNLAVTPVFQVMFALEQADRGELKLPRVQIAPIETHSGTSKFDMTLFVRDDGRALRGSFEYNTDLWSSATIERMAGHYQTLLEGIVANPALPVGLLPILTPEEERQITAEWNDTLTPYPSDRCLHELFAAQVHARPDARAVTYGSETLTYRELDERANRLAHWLRELGVGPEVLVGVYLERTPALIVAMLAIVKAGGAYLPLDLEYPPERLAFMMRDARAPVLITHSELQTRLPFSAANVILLDAAEHELLKWPTEPPRVSVKPHNLAYVIYTSGSTGIPKGVAVPQQAIARLLFNTNYIALRPDDKIGQASNAAFDAATFEIWGALLHGAELVGIDKDLSLAPRALAAFLRRAGVTTLFLTTALFNHIVAEEPSAFNTLHTVMFGGEACDPRWIRRILEHGGPSRLLHVYGPTESTTFASWHLIRHVAPDATTVPIGRPLSNTTIYVLDRNFRPVPIGVSGELCIGGDGLAVCYLDRPELTAEKFVPNPFGPSGARLYRTGDLVRYLPDGAIEFQGRIDHQVKVRGFRIELGEIEAVLGRHAGMGQVFVMVRQDSADPDRVGSSERKVVAYVVPKEGRAAPAVADLRAHLKETLPDYMVPAAFVFLDSLPINANGKVDRRSLPAPDLAAVEKDLPHVAPRSPVERFLAEKWQEVLNLPNISVTDNFFELGGNSLQAAVLTNRIQEELGAGAHVRALFMAPTIADLANYLDEYYPDAVARIAGIVPAEPMSHGGNGATPGYTFQEKAKTGAQIDEDKAAQFRVIVPPLPDRVESDAERADRNGPAVFVLSPPRSGSTLLRVMLAGNPQLFAPPELDLLSFNTLAERRAAFSGKYQFWLEGPIKAIMELKKCSADEAEAIMAGFEEQGWTTKRFYRQLQEWVDEAAPSGGRLLVDKTPVYPMDANILDRMEQDFADAKYIHLVRHPFATVYSFMEAKLEDIFFRWDHPWTMRELAELVYLVSHRNILEFLQRIPPERQHRVWFEEMVGDAPPVMQGICDFLQIDFHGDMLEPYKGDKMTSGIRPGHQMVGDFKFYLRNKIDPKAADRWKRFNKGDRLADQTWDIARQFNYEPPDENVGADQPRAEGEPPSHEPIKPRGEGAPVVLSFAQERLWFLDQFEPNSPFYNVPAAVRLTGKVDLAALQGALNTIVQRHEVLRTTFATVDGVAKPIVADVVEIPLPVVDLTGMSPEEREAEAARLAAEEARKPFDLSKGPLLRASLLRLGEGKDVEETIALVTMHHIVSDGWSVNVFIRELATLYGAFVRAAQEGDAVSPAPAAELPLAALPPLPIQYADFAAWQRAWFEGQGAGQPDASPLQRQLAYWKEHLKGLPPLLELPTDRPRPAVQTLNGQRYTFTLSEDLSSRIKALARSEGVTTFMTLLAAFQTLLMRYTGQEDIAVGAPIAGRNRPEIADLIGFFVNTLVMRGDLSGAPTFRELLKRVQATAVKAYENQDVPFEMLVEALDPQRNMSHTPLFQVMFALQDAPLQAMVAPGLTIAPLQPDTRTAKFDLLLNIVERTDVMRCALEFNTDLFDLSTIAGMAENLRTLLESIVARPDAPITVLPIQTAAERDLLLEGWNDTAAAFDTESTLAARFEEQAARTPDATAVIAEAVRASQPLLESLTYAELDRRASVLARRLAARGVGPENIVGLMTERSVDMLVGVVGIWKAGAAYVPLDPSYPSDRLAYMLADSGARVLVTQRHFAEWSEIDRLDVVVVDPRMQDDADLLRRPPTGDLQTVILEDEDEELELPAELTTAGPDNLVGLPDSLAYVIYTSGSTGRPKGVAVTHRNALNLAAALQQAAYRHSPLDRPLRLSLNAPLAFDASVQQLVMLTYGHTLVVVPQEIRAEAPELLGFIRQHRLDQLDCVPSQLKLLLGAGLLSEAEWAPSIVFPGGEAIDEATWSVLASAPATRFYNMYGPTECTVDSTTIAAHEAPARPTIGRPLGNARVYVLDRNLQPVPVGVPGELYISGAGVSRGYLNRPDLTADRFLPDPFAAGGGARMYRTGDRVRWMRDGAGSALIEFLGRVDHQVKVRGFRIELGEIEETLRRHRRVKEAVVLVQDADHGAKRLVGYVVLKDGGQSITSSELREHLLGVLPEYMAPSVFLVLDEMPLTPNAKIDRKALLALTPEQAARADTGVEYVEPTNEIERTLAQIYTQVLGLEKVGTHTSFFELGGDSILTIQVVARAGQAGILITPKQIFQAPSVAQLALLAQAAPPAAAQAEQDLVEGEAPLTPIQRRFFEAGFEQPNHWNQSLLLAVGERLQSDALQAAVGALLRHHDALRLRFRREGNEWIQWNDGLAEDTPYEYVDFLGLEDSAAGEALREHTLRIQESLNIERGPLMRVAYFDYGAGRPSRLLTVVHHLAVDRVSWRVLLEDLQTAYEQAAQGAVIQLPAKTTSFREWAHRLAEYAQSDALASEAQIWLRLLPAQAASLPVDCPVAPNTEGQGRTISVFLEESETETLLKEAGAAYGAEVNEILLAALALAMREWKGAAEVLVEVEGHGRQPDILSSTLGDAAPLNVSRTVGWFTAVHPVLLRPGAGVELGETLMAVKEQLRAAPNGGIGYGLLRYLAQNPALAALPEPQISFNYLGQFIQDEASERKFGPAPESSGPDRSAANRRQYLLDVTASIFAGKLRAEFTYSDGQFAVETIDALADFFADALRKLISHCVSPEAGGYTASDFADAGLNEEGVRDLLAELGEIDS